MALVSKITDRFGAAGSLKRRATSTAIWLAIGQFLRLFFRLFGNLIVTRLLMPEAFGLMALVTAVQVGLIMISDVGLSPAIVRSEHGDKPSFLRTAWTFRLIQFSGLAVILILISAGFGAIQASGTFDFGDSVYADPVLPWVLGVSSLLLVLRALKPTTEDLANRNLAMKQVMVAESTGALVAFAGMVGLAWIWPSVWALLIGSILGGIATVVTMHIVLPGPRMGFELNREHVRELWNFGRWMIPASALGFVANFGDRFILGALLDAGTFGIYSVAMIWISATQDLITTVMSKTGLGVLSEVGRNDPDQLGKAFRNVRLVQDAASIGSGLFFVFFGAIFAVVFYDGAFEAVGLLLPILALKLLLDRYRIFNMLILKGGDSKSIAAITLIRAIAVVTLVPIAMMLMPWPDALIVVSLPAVFALGLVLRASSRQIEVSYTREYLQLALLLALFLAYYYFVLKG